MALDLAKIRHQFPALHGGAVFLDNPGGTQAVKNCMDRILEYLIESNANHEGAFKTSRESDADPSQGPGGHGRLSERRAGRKRSSSART